VNIIGYNTVFYRRFTNYAESGSLKIPLKCILTVPYEFYIIELDTILLSKTRGYIPKLGYHAYECSILVYVSILLEKHMGYCS
jgi:hypothetical protein